MDLARADNRTAPVRIAPAETANPRFRVLGPLAVRADDTWHGIEAPKWRSLLAALLLGDGRVVPASTLIHEIWADNPPALASNLLSTYVLRLRRLIGDTGGRTLLTGLLGYQLNINTGDLDVHYFEELLAQGTSALDRSEPSHAARVLTEALNLWHGNAFADVPHSAAIAAEAERLEQLRLTATELHTQATIASRQI